MQGAMRVYDSMPPLVPYGGRPFDQSNAAEPIAGPSTSTTTEICELISTSTVDLKPEIKLESNDSSDESEEHASIHDSKCKRAPILSQFCSVYICLSYSIL